ncbi:MAG: NADH/ubiquinone/plastoquinone (complex I) [Acidimicrobiia bacterium]|nr:NADH/ubiquinone/plastoquinone (complex I) [Acidimicrobiia bacterium]
MGQRADVDLLPVLLPLTLLTAAVVAALVGEWHATAARAVAIVATVGTFVMAIVALLTTSADDPLRHELAGWPPPIGIEYLLDPLAAYMACVVALIGMVVTIYPPKPGFGRLPARRMPLYPLVLLLLAGLMGVVMSADLFHLFVFLEIYAIASYALVSLGGPRATFASFRYLIFGTIGSGFYLIGVGFLYFTTGSLNMGDIASLLGGLEGNETVLAALALIVVGLGLKMALFPLHVWLPEAHSYAPPAVAALLAAVQVKVAAYAIIRILFEVFGFEMVTVTVPVTEVLAAFGAAGILYGSVMAIRQTDFKRMLAYSTVAQLGYIGLGIGLATPLALVAALFHVLNHALMKSCLFLIAGGIAERTGIREIPRMAGLARRMPVTAAAFTVAGLAMVGIPPTAGFFSKWYLLLGSLEEGAVVYAVVIAASSLLTLWYVLRIYQLIYSRPDELDPALEEASEPGPGVMVPIVALAVAVIVLGVVNAYVVVELLEPIADGVLAGSGS